MSPLLSSVSIAIHKISHEGHTRQNTGLRTGRAGSVGAEGGITPAERVAYSLRHLTFSASAAALNLGSGRKPIAGAINVDRTSRTSPDVVHDLDVFPWPFAEGQFSEVFAFDVVEHLADVVAAMEEIHRICRDGARVEITVPHFSSGNAFTDPTHRHFFSRFSFHYFEGTHEFGFYSPCRFRVVRSNMIFYPGLLNRVVARLANRFPQRYERRWAWIFPAWFLSVELRVVKGSQPGASPHPGQ